MRKLFIIVLCATLAFVSLNTFGQKPVKPSQQVKQTTETVSQKPTTKPTEITEKCWVISNENNDVVEYRWDIETNVRQWVNEMRIQHNETYTYTSCNHKTVAACDANNEKCQPKKCWKITATQNGQSTELYLWSTETVARRKVASYLSNGYQNAIYVETPANDEKSCNDIESQYACWGVTIDNVLTFYWALESEVQNIVNEARNSGKSATYERSSMTREACLKK